MAQPHIETTPREDVVLSVRNLTKDFPSKDKPPFAALRGVSLDAIAGRVTGLVGADGAGKTTLIRIAAGLLKPTSGTVTVLGLDSVTHSIEIQSRVGYMPQKFGLYQELSISENMDLYADLQGVSASRRPERYQRLLEMTGLTPYTRRRAGALSGGMKQKLGLVCALIKSPRMLLLDEPTVGVDPVSRRELWKIVYELVLIDGIGVLVSTAYLDEAERCGTVVVLHEGTILAEGPPEEFKKRMGRSVALVTPTPGTKSRRIYTFLAGKPGVVDTTLRSGRVRVVADGDGADVASTNLPGGIAGRVEPVPPSFEDAFMSLVPRKEHRFQISSPEISVEEPDPHEEVVVETREIQKFFGDFQAVKNFTFGVQRGEIFGLLGPNGAGKSTVFRMLCGLLPASSGEIRVAGRNLRRSRARARSRLGYMAQQFSLYGHLTVLENLSFFGKAYGLGGGRLTQRVGWAFEEFGLGAWQDHAAGTLPQGYKQRLAMAVALLHEPQILFLDEPTSGIDPFARREFWLRINGFAQQGVTVIVTTHFMEEAEYCDRMLIMSQGDTLAMGTPAEIRALARTQENQDPTIEDAFVALAERTAVIGEQ
jgi:ABC-2 type transport system ATP-binding protein